MTQAIYVITYHQFNHEGTRAPLDQRFLSSSKNYIYYLIDSKTPTSLLHKSVFVEQTLDKGLHKAGSEHLGEWSFLLAEEKHAFCTYPFFMVSSRFYEKNRFLRGDLNTHWDALFMYLQQYGYGMLPSYDAPLHWVDLAWEKKLKKEVWRYEFFPFTEKTFELVQSLYDVKIPQEYSATPYLFCNYIGFQSREHLLDYVRFYKPLIHALFDEDYQPKCDLSAYMRKTGNFRNEKPFTFILEWFSHLYFYKKSRNYFALHYNGYYEIDEKHTRMHCLEKISRPLSERLEQYLRWRYRKLKDEGYTAKVRHALFS